MSWKCDKCPYTGGDDSELECPMCGYFRRTKLVLTSSGGVNWETRIDEAVTRRTYRRLYPGEEHQYVPRNDCEYPFSVIKSERREWLLVANGASPVGTTLDGKVCTADMQYPLKAGNEICICSRANPARQIAPLKVSFVLLDVEQ